jgi:hypothetical protein
VSSDAVLVRDLVARFPPLEPAFRDHLRDNFGDVLPHVFFWDVTQQVIASYVAADPAPIDWRAVLAFLADRYTTGDARVHGLIEVSFLESLPVPGHEGAGIVAELPPVLRPAFGRVRPGG